MVINVPRNNLAKVSDLFTFFDNFHSGLIMRADEWWSGTLQVYYVIRALSIIMRVVRVYSRKYLWRGFRSYHPLGLPSLMMSLNSEYYTSNTLYLMNMQNSFLKKRLKLFFYATTRLVNFLGFEFLTRNIDCIVCLSLPRK